MHRIYYNIIKYVRQIRHQGQRFLLDPAEQRGAAERAQTAHGPQTPPRRDSKRKGFVIPAGQHCDSSCVDAVVELLANG